MSNISISVIEPAPRPQSQIVDQVRDRPIGLAVLTELFGGGSVNFEWSFIDIRATVLRAKSETKGEHGPEASEAGLRSDRVFRFS